MHIGQSPLNSVVIKAEFFVIYAEQMQHRRVNVIHFRWVFTIQWFIAKFITLTICDAAFDAAAAQPIRETIRIMIAACTRLT